MGMVAFFLQAPAHAYIDPGAGSIVVQVIIAGVVCALFAIKAFFKNIKNFFVGFFRRKKTSHSDD
jgi:isochorismate hydrolase